MAEVAKVMVLAWNWLKKNYLLVLSLAATICLATALGRVVRGATWSLLMPVSLLATLCGWGLGASRLTPKQAWVSLTALGLPGVFAYGTGLFVPVGRLLFAVLTLLPQLVLWYFERVGIDFSLLVTTWNDLSVHLDSVLSRVWVWSLTLLRGETLVDPLVAGLAWSLLLWLVGTWSGWTMRRKRQALQALFPGGAVLALVLDYTRGEFGLVIVYLAILLALMGLARNEWRHAQWQSRQVDYSESIALDSLFMVGLVTIALVLSAAGAPSPPPEPASLP